MKRSELEKYLNKKVTITLFDNEVITGILCVGNGFFKVPKWYHLENGYGYTSSCVFRSSHVKKLVEQHV